MHTEKKYIFRLFLIEKSNKSKALIHSLKNLFDDHFTESYELEVIDILENPDLTQQHQIMASPTLIKETPPPPQRMVGSILNNENLLTTLE